MRWRDLGPNLLAIAAIFVVTAAVILVVEGLSELNLSPVMETFLLIPSDPRR